MRSVREDGNKEEDGRKGRRATVKVGKEIIRPFTGSKDLPPATYSEKDGSLIKAGESRHFVTRGDRGVYKLIRKYRAKGIKSALVVVIRPHKRLTRKNVEKLQYDKGLMQKLKDAEIPGAY